MVLGSGVAHAVGGNDQQTVDKVDKNTQKCQQTIGSKGGKYVQKRIGALAKRLDDILKCEQVPLTFSCKDLNAP